MTSMFAGNDSSHAAVVTLLEPPRLTFVCTTNPTSSNASSVSVLARKTRGAAVVLICGSCGSDPPAPTNNGACSHVSSELYQTHADFVSIPGVEVEPIVRYQLPLKRKASDGSRKSCGLSGGFGMTFQRQG